jgi:hypothetical protein
LRVENVLFFKNDAQSTRVHCGDFPWAEAHGYYNNHPCGIHQKGFAGLKLEV